MQTVSGQSRSADQQLAEHRRPTRRPTYREFLLGAIFPVLITVVLSPIDDSAKYHPTSLLLLGCVVAAVIAGRRAAVVCAALSAVALWWGFTQPTRSWHVLTTADAVGIGVFVAAVAGVILLVHRLDEVRQSERLERAETGLDWHWNTTQNLVPRRQAQRLMQLSESLTTAVDEQQIAEYVCSFLIDTFDGRATVALLEGDLLVVAALAGFGPDEIAGIIGSRVMLHDDSPIAEAARTNALVVQLGRVNIDEGRPEPNTTWSDILEQTSVSMPLRADPAGGAVGVMHVGWAVPHPVTESMTALAGTVSSLVTLALARIVATQAAHQVEFRQALDAMLDNVTVARSIRDDDGAIVDFVIEFVNSPSSGGARRGTDGLVGQLICEIHPDWRASGMFDHLCDVVETGTPYQGHRVQYADPAMLAGDVAGKRHQAYWTLQVAKLGDGYISASRDVTEVVLAEEASRRAALEAAAERTAIGLLQAAALPTRLPEVRGVRIAAVYEPADPSQPVGGDWYDVFALDDDQMALVIADVAGHGHSAAVFMVQVRNVFRAIAAEHTEPGDVLVRANNVTARLNDPDGPFVTCCYAVLDIATRTLRWAQAGHFSPLIVANGTSTYLEGRPGAPLAFFEGQNYESLSVEVRPGDRVLMFTDGLVERRREHLDIGLARLGDLAASHANLPTQDFVETLAASVTQRFDDLALVCVDFVGD